MITSVADSPLFRTFWQPNHCENNNHGDNRTMHQSEIFESIAVKFEKVRKALDDLRKSLKHFERTLT